MLLFYQGIVLTWVVCHLSFICRGLARTQSPTTKNCTPEFPTFGGIADFSQARCNALASTWAACLRDHKQPASGKLTEVCQLGRYEEAAVFNTCGSLTTQTSMHLTSDGPQHRIQVYTELRRFHHAHLQRPIADQAIVQT